MEDNFVLGIIAIILGALIVYGLFLNSKTTYHSKKEDTNNSLSLVDSQIHKAKKYAQKKISKSFLTGCSWSLIAENENILYIFRSNNELLISNQGLITKCDFELIVDNDSIIITKNNITELYNIVLDNDDFLFLNKISENKILIFANQTKFKDHKKSELIEMKNKILGN